MTTLAIRTHLTAHYRTRTLVSLAADLGITAKAAAWHFRELVKAGAVDRHCRAWNPPWTPEEVAWARARVGRPGWTLALVAEKLGRSESALKLKLKRAGAKRPITGPTAGALRLRDVMELLGQDRKSGNHHLVRGWIREGLLAASRVPTGGAPERRPYAIYLADLAAFLAAHPGRYEAERVPRRWRGQPNPLLPFLRRVDPAAGHLSLKQVAARLRAAGRPVALGTLRRYRAEGRFRAVKRVGPGIRPQEWFLSREAVAALERRLVRQRNGMWMLPLVGGLP